MYPLSILHLEDNISDAELIHTRIMKEGIDCNIKLVSNRQQFFKEVEDGNFDIILCDYSIPSYSGIEALALAKDKLPDVPFIFVSGTIGEERAVESLKRGATDYIIKDNLARLVPAISRAIKEVEDQKEIRRAEEELKKSEERFELAARAANDVIWDYDNIAGKIWWSDNFTKLFGSYENEDITQYDFWLSKIHPEDVNRIVQSYESIIGGKKNCWSGEYRIKRSDGSYAYVLDRGFLVYDAEGNFIRMVGAMMDISRMKKNEAELILAKEKAEAADKLKSEFLAQISHEIRTPLNTIMSFSSLLQMDFEGKMNEDQRIIFDGIETAGRRLIRTVDLILNMSLLHAGKYEPVFRKVDLRPAVKGIVNEFQRSALMRNLELKYTFKINDANITCDEYTVGQIMQNLIDNAIKYTQKGKVDVRLYKNNQNRVCIDIQDTGIGISEEFMPNLFKPFVQESTGYSRKFEGNGLGLALVKSYAEINNAEIKVQSKKEVGSTFTLIFK